MKKYCLSFIITIFAFFYAFADDLSTAKELFDMADYEAALPLFQSQIEKNPRSKQFGQLNQWAGECAYYLGDFDLASSYFSKSKSKNITEAYRFLAHIDFLNYNFEDAQEYYSKYKQLTTKAKKDIPDDVIDEIDRLTIAQSMLDRVEKITIIDSIAVPRKTFFQHFKISPDCGALNPIYKLPIDVNISDADEALPGIAFSNESKDFYIWSQPDSIGIYRICETSKLIDNSWHTPIINDGTLNENGDARFPFMMTDGVTLYFANDGENSIGGYDIFISNKDADTGEYMMPSNIGMPYNSPFDDYMLAIDENLGIGWWATDRNRLPDDLITIYVFLTNKIRICYNTDDIDISNYAKISDYKATWQPDADYSEHILAISQIDLNAKSKKIDFYFPLGNKKIFYTLDDFETIDGKKLMIKYLETEQKYIETSNILSSLRRQYHQSPQQNIADKILNIEAELESLKKELKNIKNDIYKIERK